MLHKMPKARCKQDFSKDVGQDAGGKILTSEASFAESFVESFAEQYL